MKTLKERIEFAKELATLGVKFLSYAQSASFDDESFLFVENILDENKKPIETEDDFDFEQLSEFVDMALIDINDWNNWRDFGYLEIDHYIKELANGSSTATF